MSPNQYKKLFAPAAAKDLSEEVLTMTDASVWAETNCLDCAVCCHLKTPIYSDEDVARIAAHLGMEDEAFRFKYLLRYTNGNWVNLSQPCQFLGADNKCTIYEIRPKNCADYPHHHSRPLHAFSEKLIRNAETCPATTLFLERLLAAMDNGPVTSNDATTDVS